MYSEDVRGWVATAEGIVMLNVVPLPRRISMRFQRGSGASLSMTMCLLCTSSYVAGSEARLLLEESELLQFSVDLIVNCLQRVFGRRRAMPDRVARLDQLIPEQAAGGDRRARVRDRQQIHEHLV